jgi:hypothetical protein
MPPHHLTKEVGLDTDAWLPAIVSSGVVAVLALAGGIFLRGVIEKGLQHGFDRELEKLKAQLQAKDAQIDALRGGALNALTSRSTALDQRRLKAVEAVWAATVAQGRHKMAAKFVSGLKIEAILKASASQDHEGEKIRFLGQMLLEASGLGKIGQGEVLEALPDTERLFVPPLAWAAFNAFRSVTSHAVIILITVKSGVGSDILKDNAEVVDMVKAVLPHSSRFLDDNKETGIYYLTDQLQEKVFSELLGSFSDSAIDKKVVEQASTILGYAEVLHSPNLPSSIPDKFIEKKVDIPQ